jgi:hypothetical protein
MRVTRKRAGILFPRACATWDAQQFFWERYGNMMIYHKNIS